MGSNYSQKYYVDIVMVIDATGSMKHLLDTVKGNALNFYKDVTTRMEKKCKYIDTLRVRIVSFRDYIADGKNAMQVTDFFTLPEETNEFRDTLNSIDAIEGSGGDDPEDGLEALAYAIRSKWTQEEGKHRHIIVCWSDDATHALGFGSAAPNYPQKMAKNFEELTDWWEQMDKHAKRLIIYAPEKKYWSTIADTWDNVVHFLSNAGDGLANLQYDQILDSIANTIS